MVNTVQYSRSLIWSMYTENNYNIESPVYQQNHNNDSNQIIQYGYLYSHSGKWHFQIQRTFPSDNWHIFLPRQKRNIFSLICLKFTETVHTNSLYNIPNKTRNATTKDKTSPPTNWCNWQTHLFKRKIDLGGIIARGG